MAKLSDLVNVDINRDTITIQGQAIPIVFTMKSFPYVEEAYGKEYHLFEKDMDKILKSGRVGLGKRETKLMYSLIYAMMRSGGTDCTMKEVEGSIPLGDLPAIFQTTLDLFNNQNFQKEDMEKIKQEKK